MSPLGDTLVFLNRRILLLVSVVIAVLGCKGGNTIEWSGEVTFEGDPVESGIVRFESVDGSLPSTGSAIVEGKYSVRLVAGEYRVEIVGMQAADPTIFDDYDADPEELYQDLELGTFSETVQVTGREVRNFSLEAK